MLGVLLYYSSVIFWDWVPHWAGAHWLARLTGYWAAEISFFHLSPLALGITGTHHLTWLLLRGCWESKLRSLYFCSKQAPHLAISSAPASFFTSTIQCKLLKHFHTGFSSFLLSSTSLPFEVFFTFLLKTSIQKQTKAGCINNYLSCWWFKNAWLKQYKRGFILDHNLRVQSIVITGAWGRWSHCICRWEAERCADNSFRLASCNHFY